MQKYKPEDIQWHTAKIQNLLLEAEEDNRVAREYMNQVAVKIDRALFRLGMLIKQTKKPEGERQNEKT